MHLQRIITGYYKKLKHQSLAATTDCFPLWKCKHHATTYPFFLLAYFYPFLSLNQFSRILSSSCWALAGLQLQLQLLQIWMEFTQLDRFLRCRQCSLTNMWLVCVMKILRDTLLVQNFLLQNDCFSTIYLNKFNTKFQNSICNPAK